MEIPQIFYFEKSGFFIGGRANHRFHELIRFRWLFWVKCICEAPKNLATINFLAHCIFLQGLWILDQLMYLKEGQILGLDFPKFGQIFASVWGFNFWVCFIRKVHWETILKSTYGYSRTFRPLKTEISHTCTCLMFFENCWRKLMMKKLGILHMFDNWFWKLFLARYVLLYFEFELKFAWLLSSLTAVKLDSCQPTPAVYLW